MNAKKIITFFSLFFLSVLFLVYLSTRRENRKDYHFVITKIIEGAKGDIIVINADNEFRFANFNSYKIDVEKKDSLVKKAFSKNVSIYRKNEKTDKYNLVLILNELGTFPIDWQ